MNGAEYIFTNPLTLISNDTDLAAVIDLLDDLPTDTDLDPTPEIDVTTETVVTAPDPVLAPLTEEVVVVVVVTDSLTEVLRPLWLDLQVPSTRHTKRPRRTPRSPLRRTGFTSETCLTTALTAICGISCLRVGLGSGLQC